MTPSQQKRVLFLYCGGTIGQVPVVHGNTVVLAPPKDDNEFRSVCMPIIDTLSETAGMQVTFELVTTKDSSNMTPNDWGKIIFRVKPTVSPFLNLCASQIHWVNLIST